MLLKKRPISTEKVSVVPLDFSTTIVTYFYHTFYLKKLLQPNQLTQFVWIAFFIVAFTFTKRKNLCGI